VSTIQAIDHTTLYRFFDSAGRLLYVGISGNPGRRFHQHSGEKPWWADVDRSTMEHFATRAEAEAAEVAAIKTERPLHNVVHNNDRPQPRPTHRRAAVFSCNGCGQLIADGDGYFEVKVPSPWDGLHPFAEWRAWHQRCDPEPDADTYWIRVERFNSAAEVHDWHHHLSEKNWIADTNWESLYLGWLDDTSQPFNSSSAARSARFEFGEHG